MWAARAVMARVSTRVIEPGKLNPARETVKDQTARALSDEPGALLDEPCATSLPAGIGC